MFGSYAVEAQHNAKEVEKFNPKIGQLATADGVGTTGPSSPPFKRDTGLPQLRRRHPGLAETLCKALLETESRQEGGRRAPSD